MPTPEDDQNSPAGTGWPRRSATGERALGLGLAVALVILRSAVFVFSDAVFDSDQAIVGLMTKHLAEGRAIPVLYYGLDYLLGIEAWLAAPLFWLFGASVMALKLPLLAMNVALAVLLIVLLERELGLRPLIGLLVATPFILAPPGTTNYFLEANGGQSEPLLVALLLWVTRRRPLTFGAVLAFGYLHRVFAAYALVALVLVELLDRSVLTATGIQRKVKAAVGFTAVWQLVAMVRSQAGTAWGPATSDAYPGMGEPGARAMTLDVAVVLERFCFNAATVPQALADFAGPFLSSMFGGHRESLAGLSIPSAGTQGVDGLWLLFGGALVVALGRVVWSMTRGGLRPWHPRLQFATYLLLTGAISSAAYVLSQCGRISPTTMRYTLLTVLGVVGLLACFAAVERRRLLRVATLGVVAVWAVAALWGHAQLLTEFLRDPPVNNRQVLADYLVANDIKYGYADYWDVYSTLFFANEQVLLASTSVAFIQEYEWVVQNHRDEAVWILREPCDGGVRVTEAHYVCPPRP